MALVEKYILREVTIMPEMAAANVQWVNQILKDGVVMAESLHRKAYIKDQKDDFLKEVDGAQNYLAALGWQ